MKNYFIIHALGNDSNSHWYQIVKKQIEKSGSKCYTPTLPPIEQMSYNSWSKEFDKYKHLLNSDSIVIGHSTGSIFLVKYLMTNNIKVAKYIGVVSFNNRNKYNAKPEWDKINETFFVNNLRDFKNFAEERICFYSPSDIYDFDSLNSFAETIDAKKVIIENAGHFTKGYEKEFKEIIEYL